MAPAAAAAAAVATRSALPSAGRGGEEGLPGGERQGATPTGQGKGVAVEKGGRRRGCQQRCALSSSATCVPLLHSRVPVAEAAHRHVVSCVSASPHVVLLAAIQREHIRGTISQLRFFLVPLRKRTDQHFLITPFAPTLSRPRIAILVFHSSGSSLSNFPGPSPARAHPHPYLPSGTSLSRHHPGRDRDRGPTTVAASAAPLSLLQSPSLSQLYGEYVVPTRASATGGTWVGAGGQRIFGAPLLDGRGVPVGAVGALPPRRCC